MQYSILNHSTLSIIFTIFTFDFNPKKKEVFSLSDISFHKSNGFIQFFSYPFIQQRAGHIGSKERIKINKDKKGTIGYVNTQHQECSFLRCIEDYYRRKGRTLIVIHNYTSTLKVEGRYEVYNDNTISIIIDSYLF